ncbi:hypothetical protein AJ78_01712 [Emergomyces pasteurianus Ep9510]|uniref:Zn(2)-C6 fungal-type domain-containing protein n=1 Tax=Emergomyces pasteurianus Ep9510 TaxID=1447872 RepID=A0A1J9PPB7_9EURO|nr:hypothetical protein AJ78_01712 [Emergomyces pasteurianus Ep9510]
MGRDGNRRIRAACDRCHARKLRCERQQGEDSCLRCARTDISCIYSVRQRRRVLRPPRRRPRKQRARNEGEGEGEEEDGRGVSSYQVEAASGSAAVKDRPGDTNSAPFDLAFSEWHEMHQLPQEISAEECDEFSLPNLDSSFLESMMPPQNLTLMPTLCAIDQTLTDGGRDTPGNPEGRTNMTVQHVRMLTDLNAKLFEHAAKLPPVSAKLCDIRASLPNRAFEIDDMFCLIQNLIDVINDIYSYNILPSEKQPAERTASASSSFLNSKINDQDQPHGHSNSTTPSTLDKRAPDRATFLLILSCYDRVMDIYQCLFTHIESCIKHLATPMTPEDQATQLPELRIGSYKPPIESAVAMKMFLFHTMARQLCVQLQTVLGAHESHTTSARGEEEQRGWVGGGRGDGLNNDSNRTETGWFMNDSDYQCGDIPVEDTPPDLMDKSRHDILTRACEISEQVTSIGKLLMDMSIKP